MVPSNFAGAMPRAHRADAWRRCADDAATLLRLIFRRMMGQGLLVVEHRAEIAHVKPAATAKIKLGHLRIWLPNSK
jgi:hypothetical protein